jgi:hypothetical protein
LVSCRIVLSDVIGIYADDLVNVLLELGARLSLELLNLSQTVVHYK